MALIDLYYDTTTKDLVHGLNGPGGFTLPPLRQEEGVDLSLTVLKRIKFVGSGGLYQRMNMTGHSLQLSVSDVTAVATVLAGQSYSPVDAELGKFEGVLPLNTAGINALSDGAKVYFEIRLFNGSYYVSGRRFLTTVEKAVAAAGSPQPIAGDTALGSLEASRTYVRKEMAAGEGIIWTSPSGAQWIQFMHDDGTLHLEPIV